MRKEFPILYKFTQKGQAQQWQIIVQDNTYFTREGIVGGIITESKPTICVGKNIGKKNETSPEGQALLKAESIYRKQTEKHYNTEITTERSFYEPMLAQDFKKNQKRLFTVPTFIQPKLDGLRCISQNNTIMSRNGKPYVTCEHLHQDQVIIDGELYNHAYWDDFNEIVSIIKQSKPTAEDIARAASAAELWAYDFPNHPGKFSERFVALTKWVSEQSNPMIKVVDTYQVYTMEDIEKYHDQFTEQGFEGSIIRLDSGPYEHKRSTQLLKHKDWIEEEFEVIEVMEGEGNKAGMVGSIKCRMKNGKLFASAMKGSWKYSLEVFQERDFYVGKSATVRYKNLTPDGVPRHPTITKLARETYE